MHNTHTTYVHYNISYVACLNDHLKTVEINTFVVQNLFRGKNSHFVELLDFDKFFFLVDENVEF